MKKLNKKGFTLIELMIVLAIIAILAIVLIPKAGLLKDNAKGAGVTTNVNTVRAFLETKVSDSAYLGVGGGAKIVTALTSATAAPNTIINPWVKTAIVITATTPVATTSVVVVEIATVTPSTPAATAEASTGNKGLTVVNVYTDGYIIYGVDGSGSTANMQVVK